MKFNNSYGSNEQLIELCKLLGVSPHFCNELDDFDIKTVPNNGIEVCWHIEMDYALLCVMSGGELFKVASIRYVDEGPQWRLILEYAESCLEEEFRLNGYYFEYKSSVTPSSILGMI